MGAAPSKPNRPWSTPLECLLANLRTLHISGEIRSKRLTFFCSEAWPQYSLGNNSQWPPTGTFDFDILRDLDNYCQKMGKWSEIILQRVRDLTQTATGWMLMVAAYSNFRPETLRPPKGHWDPATTLSPNDAPVQQEVARNDNGAPYPIKRVRM
ncbi:hypothetical protein K5549_012150 [Capra hircus]|nr:hypothetical protein K5549_012150 [Capra hircus]